MKRICVFCGSADGVDGVYAEAARELGRQMAARRLTLVYGGGGTGLMGDLARAMLGAGGNVIGVMPDFMVEKEAALADLPDLRIVKTMHERKAMMSEHADAFIALPGGIGTMEEFFEVWTHASLDLADEPVALLNVFGFYDPLLAFLAHATDTGFIRKQAMRALIVSDTPKSLLERIALNIP